MAKKTDNQYRPTESKYKGGAQEMYVTYDRKQKTRGGDSALYPKVKRVYIAGKVMDWEMGKVKKKSGREVNGVVIEYQQSRKGYQRKGFSAERGQTSYEVKPATVKGSSQMFKQIVEVPEDAQNVHFYASAAKLPAKYRTALQRVR
jgi:hypothetical protein